jgi:hypothetical protein
MYNNKIMREDTLQKVEEHTIIAEKMANEISSNFNPDIQNDMLRTIRNIVLERRHMEIAEIEERLNYLKNTFKEI